MIVLVLSFLFSLFPFSSEDFSVDSAILSLEEKLLDFAIDESKAKFSFQFFVVKLSSFFLDSNLGISASFQIAILQGHFLLLCLLFCTLLSHDQFGHNHSRSPIIFHIWLESINFLDFL